ncbi:serine hydrolase [Pseudomonas matsuisoli]|uniref:Beta-lactamase class A catalytic domain-containing protein n=1 Tax=Pseudomonas matsuisoli TaxID=1515666 RepID=A0A917PYQ5_9PSED|nr:serine hydrolase [Pseudomonas matsuisoli]GGJ99550.1 hypothetical protein GCM10009304_26730 [Pseudomonas matsuisoli]
MKRVITVSLLTALLFVAGFSFYSGDTKHSSAMPALEQQIADLDARTPGALGVYIKHLGDGRTVHHGDDRSWYLASTIKVPVAIATLQDVDRGRLTLEDTVSLEETDKVDGPGELVWQDAGTEHAVDELLKDMLQISDSTATGMLIRRLGEDELNRRVQRDIAGDGFGTITSILGVRYALYSEFTPRARQLDNEQIISIASVDLSDRRRDALADTLGLSADDFAIQTLEQAYENYYATGQNTAKLDAYGEMLEKLVRGELLEPATAERLYGYMKLDTYEGYRLEAGLDQKIPFAHKTGTQFERTCHVGIIDPLTPQNAIVVAACVAETDEDEAAETLTEVGKLINTLVAESQPENDAQAMR